MRPAKLECVIFAKEEVHVVELHGVGTVFCDKVGEDCGGALGRFHSFFVAVGCVNSAEAAVERAAYAGVMDRSAFAEEGWAKIFFDRDAMKGMPGKLVGAFHGALGVVARESEDVFVGEAEDGVERALASHCVEEFQQCVFSLPANDVVDVFRIQS